MNKTFLIIFGIVVIGLAIIIGLYSRQTEMPIVTSFEDCVAAGYPVMESFPEQCATPDGRTFTREVDTPTETTLHEDLRNLNITTGQTLTSPFTITGEAKTWYFEASFPIHLENTNGQELAVAVAQAQGDWMTTEFVPFKTTLNFTATSTTEAVLVFKKDNPSGLPENDEEFRLPVRLSQ